MKKLYVFADFDFFQRPVKVGVLHFDVVRGNETYSFEFDKNWLKEYASIFLSDDLHSFSGLQYSSGKDIFACFSDTLPDRWGRTLINRREQILACQEHRPVKRLSSFDYLIGIDDLSRMGGFRFSMQPEGPFINCESSLRIPPLSDLRELFRAAREIEATEEEKVLPQMKWIRQLIHPGTSLGGARPKASVIDEDNTLYVAKFPSRKDDYDVNLWEHFSHIIGRKAGLNVAETNIYHIKDIHVLLSRRFDRRSDGRRIHFASAMTLLGLNDGDNASSGFGYIDIADFIIKYGYEVNKNLEELFRRVAFNIILGNSDDHFRNHGFLLTSKGWVLSPAYDINPTPSLTQSLLINRNTNESNLDILLESAKDYMISSDKAASIVSEVRGAFKSWEDEAVKLGIPKRDIDIFAPRFRRWLD